MSNSDWEVINLNKNSPQVSKNISDWEVYNPDSIKMNNVPQESFLKSLGMAVPRIASDIGSSLYSGYKSLPGYYEKSKTELSGLPQTIRQHPGHLAGQALAGGNELINQLVQLPLNLSKYGSNRLHLVPNDITNIIQKITPQDTTNAINQIFGQPQYPGEAMMRGITRNAVPDLAIVKGASLINPLKYTNKAIAKDIIKTGENNKNIYSEKYNKLFKESENKGFDNSLNNIDIDMNTLKKYTPQKKMVGVTDFNENHTLENAHKAKSDLLRLQREFDKKTSLNTGERKHATAISNAIDSINSNMFKDSSGNLNKELKNRYENIQQGYAKNVVPYNNKYIKQYKNKEISEKKLIDSLKNNSFAIKKGSEHPELLRQDKMKKTLATLGIGGGLLSGGQSLYNLLSGQNSV